MMTTNVKFKTEDAEVAVALFTRHYLFGSNTPMNGTINLIDGVYHVTANIRPSFAYAVRAFLRKNRELISK